MRTTTATTATVRAALVALTGICAFGLSNCANDIDADEDAPFDDRSNVDEQGQFNCTEHSDTGYRNGNAFPIKTVSVDGKSVQVDTANAYIAMQAKAHQSGINLRVVSGFRTMAEQQFLYHCYQTGSCNGGNLAAVPGFSNHQSGHAIDMNTSDPGVYSWLENHGSQFGWFRTVPSEIWHWEWWGSHSDYPGPCGSNLPAHCLSGQFHGAFCDDDGHGDEHDHDRLKNELGVNFHCGDMNGHPAYCGDKAVTRADAIYVMGAAAKMPLDGHPNAFVDDNGNPREKYFNAAKAYGILLGFAGNKVKPNDGADRSQIATMLVRMYKLPKATKDYFFDDDGTADEDAHNRVAEAGLLVGYSVDGRVRKKFDGGASANRDTLATVALRAHDKQLTPVWKMPADCVSGNYHGAYCDDDGRSDENQIDRLTNELDVAWKCEDIAGHPAFCPNQQLSRAEAAYGLLKAANVPMNNYLDAFQDDNGNKREKYLNAAKAWGIFLGYDGGKDVKPNKIADRTTLAIMLSRLYQLPDPPPGTPDAFSDDNGTSDESWHNKVAYAGLFTGYDDGHGHRLFKGAEPGTKAMIAMLATRAKDAALIPVWDRTSIAPAPAPGATQQDDPPASDQDAPGANADADVGDDPAPADGPVFVDDPNDVVDDEDGGGMSLAAADEGPPPGLKTPTVHAGCAATTADANALAALTLSVAFGVGWRRRRNG